MPRSSSSRRMICNCGSLRSSASHTTTAASTAGIAARMSCANSTEPGQSMKGVTVAHEPGRHGGETDPHLVAASLGAGVADGRFRASTLPAARDRAGARQDRFEKCGFTALERAHQCDAPWTRFFMTWGTSDVLSHCRLLAGARPVIGSAPQCSPRFCDLASEKNVAASLQCGATCKVVINMPRSNFRQHAVFSRRGAPELCKEIFAHLIEGAARPSREGARDLQEKARGRPGAWRTRSPVCKV